MIYVASLYSNGLDMENPEHVELLEKRVKYTIQKVADMMGVGEYPFSPILHCHPLSKEHNLPLEYNFWQKLDRHYIEHCSSVKVLKMSDTVGNWNISKGITDEINYATSIGKIVEYVDCEDYNG